MTTTKASEREYVRHVMTGDKGWMETDPEEPKRESVRLDRPGVPQYRRYSENEWPADKDHRPLSDHQLAIICYDADAAFMRQVRQKKVKDWQMLSQEHRMRWINDGPKDDPIRRRLYKAVRKVLEPLTV